MWRVIFTKTANGSTVKLVTCQWCSCRFSYVMERSVSGQGDSWLSLNNAGARRRAQRRAEASLPHALETECDPVPCPGCGRYQSDMVRLVKGQHHPTLRQTGQWLFGAGVVAFLVVPFVITFFPRPVLVLLIGVAAVLLVAGLVLTVMQTFLGWRFDPNASAEVETRKARLPNSYGHTWRRMIRMLRMTWRGNSPYC